MKAKIKFNYERLNDDGITFISDQLQSTEIEFDLDEKFWRNLYAGISLKKSLQYKETGEYVQEFNDISEACFKLADAMIEEQRKRDNKND